MKYGLADNVIESIQKVFEGEPKIDTVMLFGSRAKGNFKPGSDIDLAVKGKKIDFDIIRSLSVTLDDLDLPYKIDLINYNSITDSDVVDHVARVGIVFYSRWKKIKLAEIGDVQTGPFGSQLHMSDYKTIGTPIITVEHLGENRIVHKDIPLVSNEDKARLKKYTLTEGDIVFSRVGSVDRSSYVSKNEDGWMFSGRLLRVRCISPQKINSKFLSYYFTQENFREHIRRIAVGATMPSINTSILSEVEVTIPPLLEQTSIAEILSSLDNKIDLLYHQNKTLEQLAETLFRQWFVEGAEDKFQMKSLGDFINSTLGGEWGKENPEGEYRLQVQCIRGTDIADLEIGIPERTPIRFIKQKKFENIEIQLGDLIMEISGGTDDQSTGRTMYINDDIKALFKHPLIFSNFCRLIRPQKKEYSFFLYSYIHHLYQQGNLFNLENGSSGIKNLDYKSLLFQLKYRLPEIKEVIEYNKEVEAYFFKINNNKQQILILSKLRDTLLPKLISGEVRVNS